MKTTRITPETKAIADAHLKAIAEGKFDDPTVSTKEEFIAQLRAGKTFSVAVKKIEIHFMSITTIAMNEIIKHQSNTYKKMIYKGFKSILQS